MIALAYMTISKMPKLSTKKFICWTAIQHVRTKKILTVDTSNGTIKLQSINCNDPLTSIIFGMWKKEKCGDIIGLQNKANKKWLGQNLFGSISCNSFKFSRREEWEVDDCEHLYGRKTTLLNLSANWGNGGCIELNEQSDNLLFASYPQPESMSKVNLFSFLVVQDHETNTIS